MKRQYPHKKYNNWKNGNPVAKENEQKAKFEKLRKFAGASIETEIYQLNAGINALKDENRQNAELIEKLYELQTNLYKLKKDLQTIGLIKRPLETRYVPRKYAEKEQEN